MHFEGNHTLEAPLAVVWDLLNDPAVLARTTPGVKELQAQGSDQYRAVLNVKMGPINSTFNGTLAVADKVERQSYRLLIDVDAKIGVVAAEGGIALEAEGPRRTRVDFTGDAKLSGKMARMGQRVLSGVARMFTKRFFTALEAELPTGGGLMTVPIKVTVNGQVHEHEVEPRLVLTQYLRDVLDLTGTHVGCDTSGCGACTVLIDGEAVKSCTLLAVQADGAEIKTVEGLESDGQLHPVQEGFRQEHGLQCGFCTPGMIMASIELLERNPDPSEAEIRHALEGNFCRCTGYENIVRSVRHAAGAKA